MKIFCLWSCLTSPFTSLTSVSASSGLDAEIYQTPAFRLTRAGQDVTLECKQNLKYNAMYWYRQDPGQGLRLIYYSTVEKDVQKGDLTEGYGVSREEKGLFPLTVKLAQTNQTSLYLCSGSARTFFGSSEKDMPIMSG
uniref:Immunoglobulin V-set domain-containing protein n=1 Tax=Rhinolophus ferrumequinum TaxID=59479 RepID=A0A671EMJ5_RHIFE